MDRKHSPLVSIITPTYNHAAWIAACIESVRAQTYPHWEQIVVDDGSTDDTAEVIRPYLDDPRIRYLRQENRGIWHLADNYNAGLHASTGDLIAILEGDDCWLPDKLEIQVPAFDDETIGLAYGRIAIVDDRGDVLAEDTARMDAWEPPFASFAAETPYPFLRDLFLLRANVVPLTLVFRRAALAAAGGFWQPRYFPAADFPTLLRVATSYSRRVPRPSAGRVAKARRPDDGHPRIALRPRPHPGRRILFPRVAGVDPDRARDRRTRHLGCSSALPRQCLSWRGPCEHAGWRLAASPALRPRYALVGEETAPDRRHRRFARIGDARRSQPCDRLACAAHAGNAGTRTR